MIWILIILFNSTSQHATSISVEFNDLESCKAASSEIQKQYRERRTAAGPAVVLCASKGKVK